MKEDSELIDMCLKHVRDNYVAFLDANSISINSDIVRVRLAQLNAEIARHIPQQGGLAPGLWIDQVTRHGNFW